MQIHENVSLKPYNTFGVEAKTRYYVQITHLQTLQKLRQYSGFQTMPHLILGGGSNVLFSKDFEGWVLHMALTGIEKVHENATTVWLKVGAGVNWHALVQYCIKKGYGGLENLSLIPGMVGAAPMQNIGAYGVEISDVFEALEAVAVNTGEIKTFTHKDCAFGYRESIFKSSLKGQYLICKVTLKLQKNPTFHIAYGGLKDTLAAMKVSTLSLKAISDAIIHIRQSKLPDPSQLGNAGSFFKNPILAKQHFEQLKAQYPTLTGHAVGYDKVKLSAAWLIEQCGWKGKRRGAAGVHCHQALVLVNHGDATGQEIWQLAQDIQQSVFAQFGLMLIPEVNIIK